MKNRIARLVDIRKIELFEEEIPALKEGELLVKLKAVGICGSDLHYFKEGGLGSFKQPMPFDIGHEPAGLVIDSKSKLFKGGARIAIEPGLACLKCEYCQSGKQNLCQDVEFMGAGGPGAFADYCVIHERQAMDLHDMSYEMGALLEPLGVAMHTFNIMNVNPNASVAIFGGGTIGLCLLAFASKWAGKVYVLDKLEYRIKLAEELGATKGFINDDEAIKQIKEETNGGVDFSLDAAGMQDVIDKATMVTRPAGKIGLVGIPEVDFLNYNPHKLRTKEITIHNIRRSNQTLHDCYDMFKDDKNIEKIITHHNTLDNIQEAFDTVADYADNVIKYMIVS